MFRSLVSLSALALVSQCLAQKRSNIVMILSDDQDKQLGSTNYMKILQREIFAQGTQFTNHFVTTAECCPSRTSLLRGQLAHNTNVTHIRNPGGDYTKFMVSGEDRDYLPFWMNAAGYRTEYIGKILNGYNLANYNATAPKGWDHVDCLVDPYTYYFNNVVMSENGQRPITYHGYHQTDVIRTKALSRLDKLTDGEDPFLLIVAPASPHMSSDTGIRFTGPPVPLKRHMNDFPNAAAPQHPNYNPPDDIQEQKGYWVKHQPLMHTSEQNYLDQIFRDRIRSLQGIDEIIEDVVNLLKRKRAMEDTYLIFTSDNGYHLGSFRLGAGKSMPYIEDTNVPFAVRGPGIPRGVTSKRPGAHYDLAPTFLDIAGVPQSKQPVFLDGRSLLQQWKNPDATGAGAGEGSARDIINVEFWGPSRNEARTGQWQATNTYKTLRVVGQDEAWLYVKWCNGDMELYNTNADPYEMTNLLYDESTIDSYTRRLRHRLNSLLMVTKSCAEDTCRDPWLALQPPHAHGAITTLKQAMAPAYDAFFAQIPEVSYSECLEYQYVPAEQPFYPPRSQNLQSQYRLPTDNYVSVLVDNVAVPPNKDPQGTWTQRNVTLAQIEREARHLTDFELIPSLPNKKGGN